MIEIIIIIIRTENKNKFSQKFFVPTHITSLVHDIDYYRYCMKVCMIDQHGNIKLPKVCNLPCQPNYVHGHVVM